MLMKKLAKICLIASGLLMAAVFVNAQEERIVFEGDRITGGLFLGMTRADVLNVSQSNNCAVRNVCTFRLPTVEIRTLVELTIRNDRVEVIRLLSGGYTSTHGATPSMDPQEVADLYDTNVTRFIQIGQPVRFLVDVPELGYTFDTTERCFRSQCVFVGEHVIYAPSSTATPTPVSTPVSTPIATPTPDPQPTPSDDDYVFIQHKPTGFRFYSCSNVDQTPVIANATADTSDCAQWRQVQVDGYFHLKNKASGKHIRPDTADNGSYIVIRPNGWVGNWTQWSYDDRGDGFGHLVNRATGKHVFIAHDAPEGSLQQQPSTWRGDYTRWQFVPAN